MLFLHITIPSSRMMNTYVKMIRDHFPTEEHRFLYYDQLPSDSKHLLNYGNSIECAGSGKAVQATIRKHMDEADVIVWHGLMFGAKYAILPVIFRRYMDKSIWIMRGLDLYNWKKKDRGLKANIVNFINRLCRKGMPNVGAIFPTDESVYREQFGNEAKCFYLPYPMSETAFEMMEDQRDTAPRASGKVYVQVANNAYTFNNHLKILDDMKHFQNKNIRVIVPLSYGNDWYNKEEDYINTVQEKACANFGIKAFCLKRLMPPDEYTQLLCNTDISIYRSNRQNALGNILRSLYVGNKVFLTKDNPLFSFFRERDITISDADDIESMTYEEFIKMPNGSKAVDWIRRTFHPEANVFYWKQMFDYFKEKLNQQAEPKEGGLTLEQEIDEALQRVFPPETEKRSFVRKQNYIDLTRYATLPVGSKLENISDVFILGTNSLAIESFYEKVNVNNKGMRWAFKGFLDNERKTVPGLNHECDIVGGIHDHSVVPKMYYLNVIEDNVMRKRVAQLYEEQDAILIRHISPSAKISNTATLERATVVLGKTTVEDGAWVREGTVLQGALIDRNAKIDSYCTLKQGAFVGKFAIISTGAIIEAGARIMPYCTLKRDIWVGEGAVIGTGAIIGAGAHILPHVVVSENQVIPPFAVVDAPVADAFVEDTFDEDIPVENTSIEEAIVEETPVENIPAEKTTVESTPVEETSAKNFLHTVTR